MCDFCSECGRVFMTNGVLDVHWQKVHGAPSLLKCLDCNTEFKRKMGKAATSWFNCGKTTTVVPAVKGRPLSASTRLRDGFYHPLSESIR